MDAVGESGGLFDGSDGYGKSGVEPAELEGEAAGIEAGVFIAKVADESGCGVILDDEGNFFEEVVDMLRLVVEGALEEIVEVVAVAFGEVELRVVIGVVH